MYLHVFANLLLAYLHPRTIIQHWDKSESWARRGGERGGGAYLHFPVLLYRPYWEGKRRKGRHGRTALRKAGTDWEECLPELLGLWLGSNSDRERVDAITVKGEFGWYGLMDGGRRRRGREAGDRWLIRSKGDHCSLPEAGGGGEGIARKEL